MTWIELLEDLQARERASFKFLQGILWKMNSSQGPFCYPFGIQALINSSYWLPEYAGRAFTIEGMAKAVNSLIKRQKLDNITLVAYSMGARIALSMLNQSGNKIRDLVLISVSPGLEGERKRAKRAQHDKNLAEKLGNQGINSFLNDWYKLPMWGNLSSHPRSAAQIIKLC